MLNLIKHHIQRIKKTINTFRADLNLAVNHVVQFIRFQQLMAVMDTDERSTYGAEVAALEKLTKPGPQIVLVTPDVPTLNTVVGLNFPHCPVTVVVVPVKSARSEGLRVHFHTEKTIFRTVSDLIERYKLPIDKTKLAIDRRLYEEISDADIPVNDNNAEVQQAAFEAEKQQVMALISKWNVFRDDLPQENRRFPLQKSEEDGTQLMYPAEIGDAAALVQSVEIAIHKPALKNVRCIYAPPNADMGILNKKVDIAFFMVSGECPEVELERATARREMLGLTVYETFLLLSDDQTTDNRFVKAIETFNESEKMAHPYLSRGNENEVIQSVDLLPIIGERAAQITGDVIEKLIGQYKHLLYEIQAKSGGGVSLVDLQDKKMQRDAISAKRALLTIQHRIRADWEGLTQSLKDEMFIQQLLMSLQTQLQTMWSSSLCDDSHTLTGKIQSTPAVHIFLAQLEMWLINYLRNSAESFVQVACDHYKVLLKDTMMELSNHIYAEFTDRKEWEKNATDLESQMRKRLESAWSHIIATAMVGPNSEFVLRKLLLTKLQVTTTETLVPEIAEALLKSVEKWIRQSLNSVTHGVLANYMYRALQSTRKLTDFVKTQFRLYRVRLEDDAEFAECILSALPEATAERNRALMQSRLDALEDIIANNPAFTTEDLTKIQMLIDSE